MFAYVAVGVALTEIYRQISDTEWIWEHNDKHYGVRIFPDTRRLIWSNWIVTAEGPQFGDGTAQTFEDFLKGVLPNPTPIALFEALRTMVEDLARKPDRRFSLFRRRS